MQFMAAEQKGADSGLVQGFGLLKAAALNMSGRVRTGGLISTAPAMARTCGARRAPGRLRVVAPASDMAGLGRRLWMGRATRPA